jgi:hypothetical protein
MLPPWRVLANLMAWSLEHMPSESLRPFVMSFVTTALARSPDLFAAGALLINKRGERFTDERGMPADEGAFARRACRQTQRAGRNARRDSLQIQRKRGQSAAIRRGSLHCAGAGAVCVCAFRRRARGGSRASCASRRPPADPRTLCRRFTGAGRSAFEGSRASSWLGFYVSTVRGAQCCERLPELNLLALHIHVAFRIQGSPAICVGDILISLRR